MQAFTQDIDVSIIIPTYNRDALLKRTLESLCGLLIPANVRFETIVCDDGSSDQTLAVIKEFEDRIDLRYCYQPDRGFRAAAARNMGICLARGQFILFLDCGVFATPHLLKEHLAFHALGRDSVVLGAICGHSSESVDIWDHIHLEQPEWWERFRKETLLPDHRPPLSGTANYRIENLVAPWTFLWGGNFSAPRQRLLEVGGFDDTFVDWGAEDIDLGYRLHRIGLAFRANKDAIAIHLPHDTGSRTMETEFRNKKRIYTKV